MADNEIGITKRIKYAMSTDTAKTSAWTMLQDLIGIFQKDPVSALELVASLRGSALSITDQIFVENLQTFLMNINEYDAEGQTYLEDRMRRFSEALAEASPNEETGYEGNPKKLHEYGKRILKAIDDCGTEQKAVFLANTSRALANHLISKKEYFKFMKCIQMLTEEDIELLAENISEDVIDTDEDYIDDFRSLGLLKEVEGGFGYTQRAYRFINASIRYENPIDIPESFAERNIAQAMTWQEFGDPNENSNPIERGMSLSHEAMILLAYASKDPNGQIMVLNTVSGTSVSTCKWDFVREPSGREVAMWVDAVEQLERSGFVKSVGKKDKIYQVTYDGYKVANVVIDQNNIDVDKSPDEYLED